MPEPTFPVRFPTLRLEETFTIRLADGTIVTRTREELEKPKEPKGEVK